MKEATDTTTADAASIFEEFLAHKDVQGAFYEDVPDAEYHAETRFISKHALDAIADCPEKYKAEIDGKIPRNETPSMRLGSALHCAVLQPERFEARYAVVPENVDRRTKAGKAAFEEWEAQNAGKVILKAEEMETVRAMVAAIRAHSKANALLFGTQGVNELTVLFRHPLYENVECKSKIDRFIPSHGLIIDLKTCSSASPSAIMNAVKDFRYDVQGEFYKDAVRVANDACGKYKLPANGLTFALVCVENKAPYSVAVYLLSLWQSLARASIDHDLGEFIRCRETREWRGYGVESDELPIPAYAAKQRGF